MERLNWAVLGLIGIVTALGLGTSSSAGKTKTEEQAVNVTASASVPACSACQATVGCCDKSLSKETTSIAESFDLPNAQAIKRITAPLIQDLDKPVCEGECPLCKKKDEVPNLDQALAPRSGLIEQYNPTNGTADCPLTKAADAISNLTKNFVCEGGECLASKGHGTLTITAVDPAPAKPEGLLNLVAAAEAAQVQAEAKPEKGAVEIVTGVLNTEAPPMLNFTTGTLTLIGTADTTKAASGTLTISGLANTKGITIATAQAEAKPAIDNSRAAARAAKLAKIEAKLEAPWELEFDGANLEDIANLVQVKYGVPVIIDRKALEEAAFDLATPIKVTKQPEIEAGEYLKGALNNLALTWIIPASGDRVLITTRTAEENMLLNRVFDVSDLVDENSPGSEGLVERLVAVVQPTTWRANGGQGDLGIWKTDQSTCPISLNTYWVQREIATLLADLRLQSGTKTQAANAVPAAEKVSDAVIRRHALPSVGTVEDPEVKHKLLIGQKRVLVNLLKSEPGFDPAVFEIVDFNNQPTLLTKQLPNMHRRIEQTIRTISPVQGSGGVFGASCDYSDFDPSSPGFFQK